MKIDSLEFVQVTLTLEIDLQFFICHFYTNFTFSKTFEKCFLYRNLFLESSKINLQCLIYHISSVFPNFQKVYFFGIFRVILTLICNFQFLIFTLFSSISKSTFFMEIGFLEFLE